MKKLLIILFLSLYTYASSPWNKSNLYDPITMSYYIPFELWLGIAWDGNKQRTFKKVENNGLKGPFSWYHPYLKKHLQVYKKHHHESTQLFTLYPKGIAKVYDLTEELFLNNGIDVPAGFGWKEGKIYSFSQEFWVKDKHYVQTTGIQVKEVIFDEQSNLKFLTFDFFINGTLKQSIKLQPTKN